MRKAAERLAAEKAEKAVDRLGLRREGLSAPQLLQETVERAGADLEYLAGQAAAGDAAYVDAYLTVLDRASRIAKAATDAGVADRLATAREAEVLAGIRSVVDVLDGACADAGLDAGMADRVRRAVAARLRALPDS